VLLALMSLAAGVVALAWPAITARALTILIAAWAFVTGIVEVALAFRRQQIVRQPARWALGGLVSIALGEVLAVRPDVGARNLATVFGLFSIVYGVYAIVLSATTRHLQVTARRLTSSARLAGSVRRQGRPQLAFRTQRQKIVSGSARTGTRRRSGAARTRQRARSKEE
jgi:hypothetical protein